MTQTCSVRRRLTLRRAEIRGLLCTGSRDAKTCNRLIAILGRDAFLRAAAMLSDPPPARPVLWAVGRGEVIRSLVGNPSFRLEDLR
jgi:hypothetical protein